MRRSLTQTSRAPPAHVLCKALLPWLISRQCNDVIFYEWLGA